MKNRSNWAKLSVGHQNCKGRSLELVGSHCFEQNKPLPNDCAQKTITLDLRQLSEKLVPGICALQTLPENLPTCECQDPATLWTHFFLGKCVAGFPKETVKPRGWKMEHFPVENMHELSGCGKEESHHFPVEKGVFFFPNTPMETLVIHQANTHEIEPANLKRAGSLRRLTHFAPEVWVFAAWMFFVANLAPANLQKCVGGFLLYKFWRIFPGIFLEDFSGHFFPTKKGRSNSARKSGGSKIKFPR